jgi:hypothetical protein
MIYLIYLIHSASLCNLESKFGDADGLVTGEIVSTIVGVEIPTDASVQTFLSPDPDPRHIKKSPTPNPKRIIIMNNVRIVNID